MDKIKNLFTKYREVVMYLIMGVATTVVNWITYACLISVINIHETVNIFISNTVAWAVAVMFAYITNKVFVFKSKTWKLKELSKEFTLFISARIVSGIVEIGGVPLLVAIGLDQSILGIKHMFSKILISVIVIVLNYIFSKFFIFKDKK